ncbi:MAG: diguanylate cyclase [Gammaproteobacteria bacterium]|nr:diguanylate cyclase [Gammaproteobacteria bacterium]MDH3862874.1 diguanylate cyclase [Gammaproteobacteria bacterium]MDH3906509.1 diguanylate cyclase [Gammaproteobacteria bacterium]MDH4003462.1 diguanylate cyclase [Gammaproteobacteria bacterium]NCF60870.1 diguanylate cyclase [Gammaproteobacteria bacterium]
MTNELCQQFGFDRTAIGERLNLLGLGGPAVPMIAEELQSHVIQPNVDSIIEDFYEALERTSEFQSLVLEQGQINHLKMTQRKYLLSLGQDFDTLDYFESRLRVGAAHERVGVSLSLYQSFYCQLQNMLLALVPDEIRQKPDAFAELAHFIVKITALDMSLAIETYHSTEVHDLEDSITVCREESELLRRSLRFDTVTRVHSRAFVVQALEEKLGLAAKSGDPLCAVMADLDRFKEINDAYGHQVGDHVLHDVATRMVTGARGSDIVGRYGGEEFLIIFENASLDVARDLSERIRIRVLADPFIENSTKLHVTVSLGVAEAHDGDDAQTLIRRADMALYEAKTAGRNRVRTELDISSTSRATCA